MSGCDRPIAVVDDDPGVLDSLRFLLEIEGYPVATYGSAAAFLRDDAAQARCLITDHHMPQMTGLELAGYLRAQGDGRRIMLITAAPSPAIRARARELGVEDVLEKPPTPEELLAFVGLPS